MSVLLYVVAAAASSTAPAQHIDCWTTKELGGVTTRIHRGYRQCIDLTEAREISGVWVNQFEGSAFYENAQDADVHGTVEKRIWLSMDRVTLKPNGFKPEYGHAYRLKMVARTAQDMNRELLEGYGHMGMSSGLVLVDEIVEWEDLGLLNTADPLA